MKTIENRDECLAYIKNQLKINPNNLVLNINSSEEDIWLFYKGSIIKSKKTNIIYISFYSYIFIK